MEALKAYLFRHPLIEGEGAGEATAARDDKNPLSEEGKQQVTTITDYLQGKGIVYAYCADQPRYQQAMKAIVQALGVKLRFIPELKQKGGRTQGEERVRKLQKYNKLMHGILGQLKSTSLILTSNPLIECLLYDEITFEKMEARKKEYRTDPGNGIVMILEAGKKWTVQERIKLF